MMGALSEWLPHEHFGSTIVYDGGAITGIIIFILIVVITIIVCIANKLSSYRGEKTR